MFVDLEGSTALSGQLDPEDLRELLAVYHGLVAEVVEALGGHVAQFLGDGALVYFGYPVSYEDDGERAIKAGLSLLERTRDLTIHGSEIRIRIGLATGLVVVGDKAVGSDAAHEPRIMGETPNIAARLQGMAGPGEIVIAESTRQLVGSLFAYESLGPVELKGVPRPVPAWKVVGASGVDDRFKALRSAATPFIGREEELDLLSRRWRQVAEEGGKVVLISGEPGVGKSRLTAAARDQLRVSQDGIVTYFCSQSFTSTALFPIARHITRTCGLSLEDNLETQRQKLQTFLGSLAAPEALALLGELISAEASDEDAIAHLSPGERRKATFDLLVQHCVSLAQEGPAAIVFEDIHWADPSTLELLDLLVARVEPHRILLMATFRPEFQPTWAGLAHVTLLTLSRLSDAQQRRLIEAVAGSPNALSLEIVEEIAERTDGVPLFLEELTKAAIEVGGASDPITRAAAKTSVIPATLHGSLTARLDRLGPTARQVAQRAAIIGREFTLPVLKSIWAGSSADMERALENLREAGLIFTRGSGEHTSYIFKHALVQDAAYSTLLRGQKKMLHRAVADGLVQQSNATKVAELIARHYHEAQDPRLAAEWRLKAGEASNERLAYREAVENLRQGLTDVMLLPETRERQELELRLNIAMTVPLSALHSFTAQETIEVVERAEALSVRLGKNRPARLLFQRWLLDWGRAEHEQGYAIACEMERAEDPGSAIGTCAKGLSALMTGRDLRRTKTDVENVVKRIGLLGRSEIDQIRFIYNYDFHASISPTILGPALYHTGFPDRARQILATARKRAHSIRHPMSLCTLLTFEIDVHYQCGDLDLVEKLATELQEVATGANLGLWPYRALQYLAVVHGLRGDVSGGLRMLHEAISAYDEIPYRAYRPTLCGMRSRLLRVGDDPAEALRTVDEGIEVALSSGEKGNLSDLRRLRGDLLIAYCGHEAEAEAENEFREALALAQQQKALSYELRAAHALASLIRSRGDAAGALHLLEPVFDRFTEGFDTADLISARKTIYELKAATRAPQQNAAS